VYRRTKVILHVDDEKRRRLRFNVRHDDGRVEALIHRVKFAKDLMSD
jgi:hypothetical protein